MRSNVTLSRREGWVKVKRGALTRWGPSHSGDT